MNEPIRYTFSAQYHRTGFKLAVTFQGERLGTTFVCSVEEARVMLADLQTAVDRLAELNSCPR